MDNSDVWLAEGVNFTPFTHGQVPKGCPFLLDIYHASMAASSCYPTLELEYLILVYIQAQLALHTWAVMQHSSAFKTALIPWGCDREIGRSI